MVFFEIKKRSRHVSKSKRKSLYDGQKGKCAGCGKRFKMEELHLHHIGKTNRISDIQLLCPNCHAKAHEWKTKSEPLIYGKARTLVRKRLGKK
ncbi:HNH endonuclease [Candidatus Bathyarchaeota archaeon]|nr:HNH endonuclease [Candidatus Bathyarchaeota archaeon]